MDALTTKDLSQEYDNPQTIDTKQVMGIAKIMLPIHTSNIAKNNDSFNYAYNITIDALKTDDITTLDSKICIYEHAIELYLKSWEEDKTYVALANSISLILAIYICYNKQNINIAQELFKKGFINTFEVQQKLLKNPSKPIAINKYEDKQKKIFKKYNELVINNIKLLKQNIKFCDLGDFYLAMCYFIGFADEDFDYESCAQTAFMMLVQQDMLGNKYAERFLKNIMSWL